MKFKKDQDVWSLTIETSEQLYEIHFLPIHTVFGVTLKCLGSEMEDLHYTHDSSDLLYDDTLVDPDSELHKAWRSECG